MNFYIFICERRPEGGNTIEREVFKMAKSRCEEADFIVVTKTVQMVWISVSVTDPYIPESDRQKALYKLREKLELEK